MRSKGQEGEGVGGPYWWGCGVRRKAPGDAKRGAAVGGQLCKN